MGSAAAAHAQPRAVSRWHLARHQQHRGETQKYKFGVL